jgi:hypothetical protein
MGEWQILRNLLFSHAIDAEDAIYVKNQWLSGLAGLSGFAGNTTTEITRVGPNELDIERAAPLGFTAVELVLLADWFCGANSE